MMPNTVADVMTHSPICVRPETPLKQAIKILAQQRISGLPVVDENGNLVGILSETDLMWQESGVNPPAYIMFLDSVIYLENPAKYERDLHKALGQTVKEVMTEQVVSVTADKPLREAAQMMHADGFRRLPVIDASGKVIGILTRGDIIQAMAASQE